MITAPGLPAINIKPPPSDKIIIALFGILLGWMLSSQCSRKGGPVEIKRDTVQVIEEMYDTLFIKDTVYVELERVKEVLVEVAQPAPELDSLLPDLAMVRTYHHSYTGRYALVDVRSEVFGRMLNQEATFSNLTPSVLKTTTITNNITERIPQRGLFVGAYLGTGVMVGASYLTRPGWQFHYNYAPGISATGGNHYIGVSKRIF